MKRKTIIVILIIVEVTIVITLTFKMLKKVNGVLGVSVTPLKVISQNSSGEEHLKYFYELENIDMLNTLPKWIKRIPDYSINNEGLNQWNSLNIKKDNNTFRIATIGDSFTFGFFVNSRDNYPSTLIKLLNSNQKCTQAKKFEVLNLGVPGYDIQYSVERLKLRGLKYDPDLIVWFLKDDDFEEIYEYIKPLIDENISKIEKGEELGRQFKEGLFPQRSASMEDYNYKYPLSTILEEQKKHLEEINRVFNKKIIIVTFPFTKNQYKELLKEFKKNRNNVYVYDQLIDIYSNQENYFPDRHPTEKGYKLIANDIYDYMMKEKIVPCQ